MLEFIKSIPTGIFILLSALIAALVTIGVSRSNNYRSASTQFLNIITNELKEIYPTVHHWPESIDTYLKNKYPTIQSAVAQFEKSVPWYKGRGFKKAWEIYRVGTNPVSTSSEQEYHQYMGFTIDDHYIDPCQRLKENIDRLLSYAKQT